MLAGFELLVGPSGTLRAERMARWTAVQLTLADLQLEIRRDRSSTASDEASTLASRRHCWKQSPASFSSASIPYDCVTLVYDVAPGGQLPISVNTHPSLRREDTRLSRYHLIAFRFTAASEHLFHYQRDEPVVLRTSSEATLHRLYTALVSSCSSLHKGTHSSTAVGDPFRRTLSTTISQPFRRWVSQSKRRYETDGYSLDLAYISPRVIAMGIPTPPGEPEHWLRNDMTEVHHFLQARHPNRFLVVNLCSERVYPPSCFDGRFIRFPFDDHQPPPLPLLMSLATTLRAFLLEHEENVLAIHCKAGKGRTGVAVVALQLIEPSGASLDSLLAQYATARTENGKGVNIPSQLRFLRYFERCVRELDLKLPLVRATTFTSCTITTTPWINMLGGCTPFVVVRVRPPNHHHRPLFRSEWRKTTSASFAVRSISDLQAAAFDDSGDDGALATVFDSRRFERDVLQRAPQSYVGEASISLPLGGITIADEVCFDFYDGSEKSPELMCSCWVHTSFLDGIAGVVSFSKSEMDGANKGRNRDYFDDSFAVAIHFSAEAPQQRAEGALSGLLALALPGQSTGNDSADFGAVSP